MNKYEKQRNRHTKFADRTLFHPCIAGDDGGVRPSLGGLNKRANGGQEPSHRTHIAKEYFFAVWWHCERPLSAVDDESFSSIFPFETRTL